MKRPDTKLAQDVQGGIVLQSVHGAMMPDTEPDIAQKQMLGNDTLYIEDEDIRALIYLFMMEDVMQVKTNDAGDIVYLIDPVTKTYVFDNNGVPVPQYVKGQKVKYTWAAVYALCNTIASLEIVLPQDRPLYRMDIDEVIDDTIDKLSEEEIQAGAITFLYAIRSILYRQLDDSVNGNKLKIMRELRISKQMGLDINKKEKKGVI